MELFNSVGIELEIENIRPDDLNLSNLNLRLHRDASCESDGYVLNGIKIDVKNSSKKFLDYLPINKNIFGCELVTSGTLDTSDLKYLETLKSLTNILISHGESPRSYRAGFHVHINVAYNLQILKSIVRLSRHLEQVLYLLGGMGYDYRGQKNDSAYCRPFTRFGPVCVKTGWGYFAQVFTPYELLKSETTSEFKNKYGNVDALRNSHFLPVRYHGVNLLPLFTQGSLEFRMFNKSTNPYYLMAIIEFCKAFSSYAVKSSFKSLREENLLIENSLFDVKGEQDRDKIIETFFHFIGLSDLENKEIIETLHEILLSSSVKSLVIPKKYVYSHLIFHRQGNKSPTHWMNREYSPKKINENLIQVPKFEDIHVLREREPGRNFNTRNTSLRRMPENLQGRRFSSQTRRFLEDTPSVQILNAENYPDSLTVRYFDEFLFEGNTVRELDTGRETEIDANYSRDSFPGESVSRFYTRMAQQAREFFNDDEENLDFVENSSIEEDLLDLGETSRSGASQDEEDIEF